MIGNSVINELERIIKGREHLGIDKHADSVLAGVVLILKEEEDKENKSRYSILFLRRAERSGDTFSGHISFPGGRMENEDRDQEETAIRETLEETGIDLRLKGRILGRLDDVRPVTPRASHFIVTPYVASVPKGTRVTANEEVAEVIWIPVSYLKSKESLEIRHVEKYGMKIKDFVFTYRDHVVWGMTGRILYQFLSLVGHLFC